MKAQLVNVDVELATEVGLNEAILYSHLKQRLESGNVDYAMGKKWIRNTFSEWQKELPFFSRRTIIRTIKNLREQDLILVEQLDKSDFDNTNYYAVKY